MSRRRQQTGRIQRARHVEPPARGLRALPRGVILAAAGVLAVDGATPGGIVPSPDSRHSSRSVAGFYTFALRVDGPARQLEINAGVGGEPAVQALLGFDR